MALDTVLRKGVAIADKITKPLQAVILHDPWVDADEYGKPRYASDAPRLIAPTERKVLIGKARGRVYTKDGEEIREQHTIDFIGPVPAFGSPNRSEPVDPRDRITLPDGSIARILSVGGPLDPATGRPYVTQVSIG